MQANNDGEFVSRASSADAVAAPFDDAVAGAAGVEGAAALATPPIQHAATVSAQSVGSKRKGGSAAAASSSSADAASLLPDDEEKQAAASSSSFSSAANPHLASVLESASASAPVAKRTRRAQQTAHVSAERIAASPMLRLMGQDGGARLSLLQLLPVRDLGSLVASGGSWSSWIAEEPASVGAQQVTINGWQGTAIDSFAQCSWMQRSVQFLSCSRGDLPALLRCVSGLFRLRSLELNTEVPTVPSQLLRQALTAAAATLTDLRLSLPCFAGQETALDAWAAISVLTGLVSLRANLGSNDVDLDFSFLTSMLQLERLEVRSGGFDRPRSSDQVEVLAQCRALTDLLCGQWIPSTALMIRGDPDEVAQRTLIHTRFALLVQRRKKIGAAPFRRLWLGDAPLIDPIGWQTLVQCAELEDIEADWSSALLPEDWARLAQFQQLRTLFILGRSIVDGRFQCDGPLSDLSHVLPPLLSCRTLWSLTLGGEFSLRFEHAALIARLPSLTKLTCIDMRIESLASLTTAPAVTALQFYHCTGLQGERINIRELIPPMPLVSKLTIIDAWENRLTLQQAEPFNATLFARLPKLTLARFVQL